MDANSFPFTADVRIQDAMLYSPKIEPISWPEDIIFHQVFDISMDEFDISAEFVEKAAVKSYFLSYCDDPSSKDYRCC